MPQARAQAGQDNSQASGGRQHGFGNPNNLKEKLYDQMRCILTSIHGGGQFGPDICEQGFVSREAADGDHVCVPASTRTHAQENNRTKASRREPGCIGLRPRPPPPCGHQNCAGGKGKRGELEEACIERYRFLPLWRRHLCTKYACPGFSFSNQKRANN
jgi:hypothetical protein